MPLWTLVAAGCIPDDDHDGVILLQTRLAALLSDPRWQGMLSSFHADTRPPVRAVLHLPGEPLAASA